jgi:hypothetical protein
MTTFRRSLVLVTLATVVAASPVALVAGPGLQDAQSRPAPKVVIPAKVDVVIQRYQGDKRVASLPYSLTVSINGQGSAMRTSLRMGVDVPIGTTTTTREGVTTTQPSYRNVGTNVDCSATSRDDGRFDLYVNVSDSAISSVGSTGRVSGEPLAFRTFTTSNSLALRDGQPMQFTAATDPVTGDVIRIEVTLTTIK